MSLRNRFRRQQTPNTNNSNVIGGVINNSSSNASNTKKKSNKRDTISRFLNKAQRGNSNSASQQALAPFDACIEACDALAASSTTTTCHPSSLLLRVLNNNDDDGHNHINADENANQKQEVDFENNDNDASASTNNQSILSDCSVLVSPDGALLFTSQTLHDSTNNNNNSNSSTTSNNNTNKYPWTNIPHTAQIPHEEYTSAIITGNDRHPSGDYASNGFTARGWNVDAASMALRSNCEVLEMLTQFVDGMAKERNVRAEKVRGVCTAWRVRKEKLSCGSRSGKGKKQMNRVGPLLSSGSDVGTNISIALETMEEYFSHVADEAYGTNYNSTAETSFRRGEMMMLPELKDATIKAQTRTCQRETALNDARKRVMEAQNALLKQKEVAANQWKRVRSEEDKIDRLLAERREEQQQHYLYGEQQQRQRDVSLLDRMESEPDISADVWELVKGVASMEDFGHTGYSPRVNPKISMDEISMPIHDHNDMMMMRTTARSSTHHPPPPINRADIERESDIQDIRMKAHAADEAVEDASSQLLNMMSKQDTTMRSARVATESCLLSGCNAVHNCLRSLVEMERAALEERLKKLEMLETAVDAIDVRKDIDIYIQNDKLLPGGCSRNGEDDDGGVAAALAVLNSHAEIGSDSVPHPNIERPNHFEGWGGEENDDDDDVDNDDVDEAEPELFGEVINILFRKSVENETESKKEGKVALAATALKEKSHRGQSFRQTILYELNNQRSKNTQVSTKANFEALCRLFDSFLSGCGREAIDVSNAKMAMILSQTFYFVDQADDNTVDDRERRVYVKNRISHHSIWTDDEFWDHALEQCVAESLQKSGVLMNYAKSNNVEARGMPNKSIKWHDLAPSEYAVAAAQVHSVTFATLGSLAHSMLEMDVSASGLARACNFVRRLSVRYQLPLKMRITLLDHLQNNSS